MGKKVKGHLLLAGSLLWVGSFVVWNLVPNFTASEPLLKDNRRALSIPRGAPTKDYLEHSNPHVEYYLALDTGSNYFNFENATMYQFMEWGVDALHYRNAWLARVGDFRRFLSKEGFNNVDPNISLENSVFRKQPRGKGRDSDEYIRGPKQKVNLHADFPLETCNEDRFTFCFSSPAECGEINVGPVVDMSLVIPLNSLRFNNSWPTLESVRQLVVFPKEIVLIIGGIGSVESEVDIFSYLNILKEVYGNCLPRGVTLKAHLSRKMYMPGENRWYGFNQTSSPIVMFFDGDDYIHPQLFQALWHAFDARPELDYALIQYEVGAVEGAYHGEMYYGKILRHLRLRHYSMSDIVEQTTYPDSDYKELRQSLPTWGKTWYLGNTDAEPNWGGESQRWWDPSCHNGWVALRRHVMESVTPPTHYFGGEDAIYNYRVIMSGFHYRCISLVLGIYLKCFCDRPDQPLWTAKDLEGTDIKPQRLRSNSSAT